MSRFTRTGGLGVIFLSLPLVARPSVGFAQSKPAERSLEKIARAFTDDLIAGRYDHAVKPFDATMTKALPADQLRLIWEGLPAKFGAFKSAGPVTTAKEGPYAIAWVELNFEKSNLRMKIAQAAPGEISGLWFLPTETPPFKPPSYAHPDRYTEKKITIGKKPWQLPGKLTTPKGDGPFPVVVLVHGSGPHDEDETIGPNKPFLDLAAGLSSNGIAVLRYEKRTHAHGAAMVQAGKIDAYNEVIDDAVLALELARKQSKIDPKRVFLLGHSLGATLAPHIAEKDGKLAGMILLSGSSRDFFDVIADQLTYIASVPGPAQEENRKECAKIKGDIELIRAGKKPLHDTMLGASIEYWKDLGVLAVESSAKAVSLPCRVLVCTGGRDYQVTEKDFDLYQKALTGKPTAAFKWYKSLNHLYMTGKGKATPDEYAVPGHVDEGVIRDLVNWINAN